MATDREVLEDIQATIAAHFAATNGGAVIHVPAGGDLQTALNQANGRDVIELDAGGVYPGAFQLPDHGSSEWVTLRVRGELPARRTKLTDAGRLATIVSSVGGVPPLTTARGAHHWRLQGIGLTQTGGNTYGILRLGEADGYQSESEIPHHFELDRILVYVLNDMEERRGIQCNASDVEISRSAVLNIKEAGADSQAVCAWDTPGRILIEDCTLEGAGENLLIGGVDPSLPNMVPSDLSIVGCTLSKPLTWRGAAWQVKNLLELKNARRVLISGNVLTGCWAAAQTGYAVLLTPRNQGGSAPWSTVEDVTFEYNRLTDSASGLNILGTDNEQPSQTAKNLTVRHNLFVLSAATFGGEGRPLLIGEGPVNVTVDHNTWIADGPSTVNVYGNPSPGFRYTNNLARHNLYGVIGAGTGVGTPSIEVFFPGADFRHSVLAGGQGYPYPDTTQLPSVPEFEAQFMNYQAGDYRLKPTSAWKGAGTDGQDLGADLSRLPR